MRVRGTSAGASVSPCPAVPGLQGQPTPGGTDPLPNGTQVRGCECREQLVLLRFLQVGICELPKKPAMGADAALQGLW